MLTGIAKSCIPNQCTLEVLGRITKTKLKWSELFEGFSFEICVSWWLMYGILVTPKIDLMKVFYRFDFFSKIFTDKLTLSYISEVREGQWTVSRILRYQVWNHKGVSIFSRWQVFHVRGQIVTTMWCEKFVTSNFKGPKSDVQVLKLSKGFWHEFTTTLQRCQDFFSHGLIISCQNTFRKWMQTCFAGRIETSCPKGQCIYVANIRST